MRPFKFVHVVGARPNFPKAAPVIRALEERGVSQSVIHTGQHHSRSMYTQIVEEVGMRIPNFELGPFGGVGSGQIKSMLDGLYDVLSAERPDWMIVYGDVTSTLVAALAASRLGVKICHVEAGLRSFDLGMPEEHNRVAVDALSSKLFTTEESARINLINEGHSADNIVAVGNTMIDTLMWTRERWINEDPRAIHGLSGEYCVVTLHRPSNVDDLSRLRSIVEALHKLPSNLEVVLPVHPRLRRSLEEAQLFFGQARFALTEPLGYLGMISLLNSARFVITDSGGIQEETSFLGVPCLTVRENTERPVTLVQGSNRLIKIEDLEAIVLTEVPKSSPTQIDLWDGKASERIAESLLTLVER